MTRITMLVPTRFLTITSHLVITIVLFFARDDNIKACLPVTYTREEYAAQDTALVVGLSVSLGLFLIELLGFFSGISMFVHTTSLLSIAAHTSGAISLSFFLFETWECHAYWIIFALTNCLPAIAEIITLIGVAGMNKTL